MLEPPNLNDTLEMLKAITRYSIGVRPAPGCHTAFLSHPTREDECVKLALVDEHRFAFTYWVRWWREFVDKVKKRGWAGDKTELRAPTLVSIDWHNDVGTSGDLDFDQLSNLEPWDETFLGLFSWICLPGNNDGQILPALHLNVFDNVYVLLKQLGDEPENQSREHIDRGGEPHRISYYSSLAALVSDLEDANPRDVVLDLDLDYFTEWENDEFDSIRLVSDSEISETLDPAGPLMRALIPRLNGLTIALEPKYCGGIRNSFHVLEVIDHLLFTPGLFHDQCTWRKAIESGE